MEIVKKVIEKIKQIGAKKISIGLVGLIIFIIILSILYSTIESKIFNKSVENKNYTSVKDFTTVREVAVYMGCNYKKEEALKDDEYTKKIYLDFNKELYSGKNSNRKFFERLSIYMANVLRFDNFLMIDEIQNITIGVICDSNTKEVKHMVINGNPNYFDQEDSKLSISKYEDTKNSNINVNTKILTDLINNQWIARNVNFGTKDSTFDGYDIYFDEGIEVKKIGDKVFNIVFTSKYNLDVVNNVKVGEEFENIKAILGEPAFENSTLLGYKDDNIYVFFGEDEISIYKVQKINDDDLLSIIKILQEGENIKKVANALTNMWEDYDEYNVTDNSIEITYTLRGIKLQYNVSSEQGIVIYKNYNGNVLENKKLSDLKNEELPKNVYIKNSMDLVFLNEEVRSERYDNYYYYYGIKKSELSEEKIEKTSQKYYHYKEYNGNEQISKFVNLNKEYPNIELNINYDSYLWLDDYIFVYSISNKGIYAINLKNKNTITIIEGTEKFELKEYDSNVLKYDDKTINIK